MAWFRKYIFILVASLFTTSCASFREFFFGTGPAVSVQEKLTITTIPARKEMSRSGDVVFRSLENATLEARDEGFLKELAQGNVPEYERVFRKVRLPIPKGVGLDHIKEAYIWVMPDYLAVGSNRDAVRVPLNPMTAQKLADQFECILPTAKIVDLIYKSAEIKLPPAPKAAGPQMTSIQYYLDHNRSIQSQINGDRFQGKIIAGHKKDVVLTNRLNALPQRVAIYGWHRLNGRPIQPVSLVHGIKYADYSHGIRLIYNQMVVNGSKMSLKDVLKDPKLSILVSDEGPLKRLRVDGSEPGV